MKNLLIDGKNNAYRSVFAGFSDFRFTQSGNDYFVIFLRFLSNYVNKFRPNTVNIFWDAPSKNLWRKTIYNAYKEHRENSYSMYEIDVPAAIKRQVMLAGLILSNLNVRQYYRSTQEADDLVYAYTNLKKDDENIIVSADGDFKQLTFRNRNIKIHNPLSKNKDLFESVPERDPILIKCLTGDKSDNIDGYYQIGPERSKLLIDDSNKLAEFFKSPKAVVMQDNIKTNVGDKLFNLNMQIIDLSKNPECDKNNEYVGKQSLSPISFNTKNIEQIINKFKVKGLMSEISNLATPFRGLV